MKASALLAVAVVLGLLTVNGTYALWNKVVPAGAGTIQAADFRVSLTDLNTGVSIDMTSSAGNPALVPLAPSGNPSPDKPIYVGVRVSNATNAGSNFAVRASTGAARISSEEPGLSGHLSIKVRTAPVGTASCSSVDFMSITALEPAVVDINKGESAVLCFQILPTANAPSGGNAQIEIPITVDQL